MNGGVAEAGRAEEAGVPAALRGSVSRTLRTGLVLAGLLALAATVGYVRDGVGVGPSNAAVQLRGGLLPALEAGDPSAYALLAIAVLVATPLARVAISTALFGASGQRTFFLLTLVVLSLLGATILVGAFA